MERILLMILLFAAGRTLQAQWLRYPAISPNGKLIAFTCHGDIYIVPSEGGRARPLVLHEAHDFMPVWSRDGNSIAFASNRYGNFDVFITDTTGNITKRLTRYSVDEFPSDFSPGDRDVIFAAARLDAASNRQFPSEALTELYRVPAAGGRIKQVLTTPAEDAKLSNDGKLIAYHDRKGRENPWRKHHTSAVARDIWLYETTSGVHRKLSSYQGEDRNPVFSADQQKLYWLSERSGSFNIHEMNMADTASSRQVSFFTTNPVRFLSISGNNILCFAYDGKVYIKKPGREPEQLSIYITGGSKRNNEINVPVDKLDQLAVAPNAKEIAFIFRGEVFVADREGGSTRRITHTPEAESGVSFSPDGRFLLYASERQKSWKIIRAAIGTKNDSLFHQSPLVRETVLIANEHENYQPEYSPDGREIAYIQDRNSLKVFNIASGRSRTILTGLELYSRRDNDQYFRWSPDGKWLLVQFNAQGSGNDEVGIVDASGKGRLINITRSGYTDSRPKWMMRGKMIIWQSDRQGLHSYANSSTRQNDIFALRIDSVADWENISENRERLTIYPSQLSDALVSTDGIFLYYLSKVEGNYDLWVTNLRTRETKVLLPLNVDDASMEWDSEQKEIFVLADGKTIRVDPLSLKRKTLVINATLLIDEEKEREAMFEHVWRRTKQTFYTAGLHGADWDTLNTIYSRYLSGIDNGYDFAEMLSELLGELNVSHTGASFDDGQKDKDATASLGLLYDHEYDGKGIRIEEVLPGSPLQQSGVPVKKGDIIVAIDGINISPTQNIEEFLNRKAGENVVLAISDGTQVKEARVKGISLEKETQLVYKRWVNRNRKETEKLSGGKLGYVHLYRMNDAAYRDTYEDVLGKFSRRNGLVVDTRFNRGGDLAPELTMFLTGRNMRQNTNDQYLVSTEPTFRWTKPSVLLVNEANYSDGQCFAFDFQHLRMGKMIGMPVPGSCTWMTGESLQDPAMHYSVPTLGVKTNEGRYMENYQTHPDLEVANDYRSVAGGRDLQLEAAVKELMSELNLRK